MNTATITLLYCPCPSLQAAQDLAQRLLEARVIACSNIVPHIESFYTWQGQPMQETEVLLLAKTSEHKTEAAMHLLATEHPYELPAVCAMAIKTTQAYAAWVASETAD